jgi:ATP-binding cassette subfamily B protein
VSVTADTFTPAPPRADYPPPAASVHTDRSLRWFRRMLPFLRAHRGLLAVSLGGMVLTQVFTMIGPFVLRSAIDDALVARVRPLDVFVWVLVVLSVGRLVAGMASRFALHKAGASIQFDLRSLLQRHLGAQSFSYFDESQTGQMISRANADLRAIEMFLIFGPAVGVMLVGAAIALGLMFTIHIGLTLVATSTLPLVYWVGIRMRRTLFPLSWLVQARTADVATVTQENMAGAHVVRAMNAERDQIRALDTAAERLRWVSTREVDVRAVYQPLIENLPRLATALFVLYAGILVIRGSVTIGTLVLFTSYVAWLQSPFRILGFMVMLGQRARASASRIFEIIDHDPEIVDRADAVDLVTVAGDVRFEHVRFGYGDGPDILVDFDLRLRPGETVALVGRTGSGKSTAARLLPRFYDVRDGAVLIDGTDVRGVTLGSLRAHVGMVTDEPFLFSTSVRDNIAYTRPDAAFEEVCEAARAAGAAEFIDGLPQGYDTVVGERGYTLSGGQRQRLAIARTLLANPEVLILDDATSAVDVHVEREIHAALEGLLHNRTTLIIAHRLSTIALADRVAILADGRVLATGTHAELLASEPRYADILAHSDEARQRREAEAPTVRAADLISDEELGRAGLEDLR